LTEPSDVQDGISGLIPPSDEQVAPAASPLESQKPESTTAWRFLWQGKPTPAFWTIASIISLTINIILFVALIILGTQIFNLKAVIEDQLIGGLYDSFVQMDEADIITTIYVSDTIQVKDSLPVVFNLPVKQETEVVLTRDAAIKKATVFLNGAPVPTDIILKRGTRLSIYLDMNVPVDQVVPVELAVPVHLTVPVHIPLNQTELHQPFVGLQEVVLPYKSLLEQMPDSWAELICDPLPDSWCE
jgi:hypothetical protein